MESLLTRGSYLRAAVLFSGGKDSTLVLHEVYFRGVEVGGVCVARPIEDSRIFHYPYTDIAVKLARAMGFVVFYSETADDERSLETFLRNCLLFLGADTLAAGVLSSDYQRMRLEAISRRLGATLLLPLWGTDPVVHLERLWLLGIRFMIVRAMAYGIPPRLVGKELEERDLEELIHLSLKHSFNPAFEGGEAETLVVKAPLLRRRVRVEGEARVLAPEVTHFFINRFEVEE